MECPTDEVRDELLGYHGWAFDQARLVITRYEYELNGDEIFEFITSRLRTQQELEATREAYGCPRPESPRVLVVEATPQPRTSSVQISDKPPLSPERPSGKGKGGTGSRPSQGGSSRKPMSSSKGSGSRGKGKGGERFRSPNSRSPTRGDQACWECEKAGRPYMHYHRTCSYWQAANPYAPKMLASNVSIKPPPAKEGGVKSPRSSE